jgi:hypothetical protein
MLVPVQSQQASMHLCVCQSVGFVALDPDVEPYVNGSKQHPAGFDTSRSAVHTQALVLHFSLQHP